MKKYYAICLIFVSSIFFAIVPISAQTYSKAVSPVFTIIGEVNDPGTYAMQHTNMNICEALAMAGDMTVFGMRSKIKVTRVGIDGKFHTQKLNLDRSGLENSPYFILKPDDIIYVTPNRAKTNSAKFGRKSTIWVSFVSTFVSVGGLVIQKLKK